MLYFAIPCIALAPLSLPPVVSHDVPMMQTATALIGLLGDESVEIRQEAATALASFGPEVVPALNNALRDENKLVRIGAANTLGQIGRGAKGAVFALAAAAREGDKEVRIATIDAVGRIGYEAGGAILHLVRLGDDDQHVRASIRDALRGIGGSARFVPELIAELRNTDPSVRAMAAFALGLAGSGAKEAVFALTAAIRDEDRLVRLATIEALGDIGPVALPAVIALVKIRGVDPKENDPESADPDIYAVARSALIRIGGSPELVPALIDLVGDPDDEIRTSAAHVLAMIGPEARPAVPSLALAAREGSDAARAEAARALRRILP